MDEEIKTALAVLERACASLVADLNTHQQVQTSLNIVKKRLEPQPAIEPS